jgi:hypothetical protein
MMLHELLEVLARQPDDMLVPVSLVRKWLEEVGAAHDAEIDGLFNALDLVSAEQTPGARLN